MSSVHHDPLGPQADLAPAGRASAPRVLAARRKTVIGELKRLLAAGAIDVPTYQARRASYEDAKRVVRKLSGRRKLELGAVVRTLEGIAARGALTASRLGPLWMTLERNRQWWTTAPLPANGQRVGFEGSELVWQYYPGQGIQLQELANFGKLNGLWQGQDLRRPALRPARRAARPGRRSSAAADGLGVLLHVRRRPPAVGRAACPRAQDSRPSRARRSASSASRRSGRSRPRASRSSSSRRRPACACLPSTGSGVHFLQYSFDSHLYILNGFVQSLNGLWDYGGYANDPTALALFQEGVAAARAEVPTFDTGAWSLYSRGDGTLESDLGYHKLLRDFMKGLCDRTQDPVFCGARANYDRYLVTKPALAVVTRRLRGGRTDALKFSLSKISRVGVRVTKADGTPVLVRSVGVLGYGRRSILWTAPRHSGAYTITVSAVDLAGNAGSAAGSIDVLRAKKKKR